MSKAQKLNALIKLIFNIFNLITMKLNVKTKLFALVVTTILFITTFYACKKEFFENSYKTPPFSIKLEDVIQNFEKNSTFTNSVVIDSFFNPIKYLLKTPKIFPSSNNELKNGV